MLDCRGCHDSNRTRTGYQHVLAQNREGEGSVNCVTKWVEYRRDIPVYPIAMMPHVRHGHRNVFGKCTSPVHPNPHRVLAQMAPSRQAVPTPTANHVSFGADDLP